VKLSIADAARYLALLGAMLISFSEEQHLAATHGVPMAVSFAVPVAIDLFMIWAVRTRRDVFLAVTVAVLANVAGVLTGGHLQDVSVWVSVALHGVFPLIVWRMHRTAHSAPEPSATPTVADEPSEPPMAPLVPAEPVPDPVWSAFDDAAKRPAPVEPVRPDVSALRDAVRSLSADGRVTGKAMAEHFGVSERTGRRYLAMAAA
jgi:hypothetical protein